MTTSPLGRLFGRSPFGPIQKHMHTVADCAEELLPLFAALLAGDAASVTASRDRIFDLEDEADRIKNDLRMHLPRSLFMPVDRRDLLELLADQDSIADSAQDVAGLLEIAPDGLPEALRGQIEAFVTSNVETVRQCRKVIDELDELLELGFRGREVDLVEGMLAELGSLESSADRLEMQAIRELLAAQGEVEAGTLFLWMQILQRLGDVADHAEAVGNRLRLLIAR